MRFIAVLAAIFHFLHTDAAIAETCSAALLPDQYNFSGQVSEALTIVNSISRENYKSKERTGASGLKVLGSTLDGDLSWDNFNEERSKINEEYGYDRSYEESVSWASQTLGESALAAYKACLRTKATSSPGIHVLPELFDDQDAVFSVLWQPTPTELELLQPGQGIEMKVVLTGGAEAQFEQPVLLTPANYEVVAFKRAPSSGFKVILQAQGRKPFVYSVAGPPKITLPCEDIIQGDEFSFEVVTRRVYDACNKCGVCERGNRPIDLTEYRTVNLACITGVQENTGKATRSFDCNWNPGKNPIHTLSYMQNRRKTQIRLINSSCEKIAGAAKSKGITLPKGFCS